MKRCISCKEEKGFEHFSKNRNSKDGYKNYCKKCASKYNKRYREKHKEKVNAKNREWYPKTDFYDTENEKKIYAYFKTL